MESLSFSNTSSLAALNKHHSIYDSSNGLVSSETAKNAQLELEWIRRENEKLLLENEALQLKINE
jgi:hypothetical protein